MKQILDAILAGDTTPQDYAALPLPESYRVKLRDPEEFEVVASAFRGRPGVDQVQDQKELLEPFFNVLNKLQQYALYLAIAEIVAAVLLVSNTIRVSAFGRRRETGIMRLVGASSWSIQLPFMLEGLLAGFVGAVVATGALVALKVFAIDGGLRETFQFTAFVGWDEVLQVVPWLFSAKCVSWWVTNTESRYLGISDLLGAGGAGTGAVMGHARREPVQLLRPLEGHGQTPVSPNPRAAA